MRSIAEGRAFGRVNLLGEHLDYNNGCVFPLQINRSIKVKTSRIADKKIIEITSDYFNQTITTSNINNKNNNWSDYVIGCCFVANEFKSIQTYGLSFTIHSDLPIGVGLSSSAAVCIATLRSIFNFFDIEIKNNDLVLLAQKVEQDFVGVGGGIMDQFVSVYGNQKQALFLNTANNSYELINIPSDYSFLIVNSGIKRELSSSLFNERKQECYNAASKLNIKFLCDLNQINNKYKSILTENEFKRCIHVVLENNRTKQARTSLLNNDMGQFGKLMTESHHSLKDNYEVSSKELDFLVETCIANGALGAKLTGAGFGGAIVTLIQNDFVEGLKEYILKNYSSAKFI